MEVLHGHAGRGAEGGDDLVMSRDEWGLAGRSKWCVLEASVPSKRLWHDPGK